MKLLLVVALILGSGLPDGNAAPNLNTVADVNGPCEEFSSSVASWNNGVACGCNFDSMDAWNCYADTCYGKNTTDCDEQCQKSKGKLYLGIFIRNMSRCFLLIRIIIWNFFFAQKLFRVTWKRLA